MKKILVILICSLIIMSALVSCKSEPDTFNVKLNLDGGTCTALTQYTAGTAVTLPTDAKKAGYSFGGWFDNKDLKGTAVTEIKETDTGDKEFWAKWNAPTKYTITYKDIDDEPFTGTHGKNYPTTHTYGTETTLVYPERPNYLFEGWYLGPGRQVTSLGATDYNADITLYALWKSRSGVGSKSTSGEGEQTYVQLWDGGPKWAEFNIGSTITSYSQANQATGADRYSTVNVGDFYKWKATAPRSEGTQGTADTASSIWGLNWCMPEKSDFDSLLDGTDIANGDYDGTNTKWEWITGSAMHYDDHSDGAKGTCKLAGWKVSGKGSYSNNSIFLPAAGYLSGTSQSGLGNICEYWTLTIYNGYGMKYIFQSQGSHIPKMQSKGESVPCIVRAIVKEDT